MPDILGAVSEDIRYLTSLPSSSILPPLQEMGGLFSERVKQKVVLGYFPGNRDMKRTEHTPPTKFRDCQSASPQMLANRIHPYIPQRKEIERNVHKLPVGGRERQREGGGESETERENKQVSYKGTEIRMGMNFLSNDGSQKTILKENYFHPKIST